ncbi:MAG TPA: glycine cleavage T C-terminal barrel domain-containing protein [Solirubrobacteraceae bacterium]|nr:glycine cleavage T C-terminal barrel domain-containing protein [Solirubrobacteraceae bacterium]
MSTTRSFETDYATVTSGVGLLDASERGKLALTGPDAKEFLQGQVTQDINGLTPGHGCYAALLTQKGKMLGDLRVLNVGPPASAAAALLLDTERVALQGLFNMIRTFSLGYDLQLHKRTLECGLLSLIGPLADELITGAGATLGPAEHDHCELSLGANTVRVIRTDVGVDVLCGAEQLPTVRDALLAAGAVEVAEAAAEAVRIEHGRPRYGIDLDDSVIPQEAQLNQRAVSFTKGCYVGQETVARLFYRGKPNRELRGLTSAEPLAVGTQLTLEGRVVGTVTSSSVSPRLGAIALALVRREAPVGAIVAAGEQHEAVVCDLPFD